MFRFWLFHFARRYCDNIDVVKCVCEFTAETTILLLLLSLNGEKNIFLVRLKARHGFHPPERSLERRSVLNCGSCLDAARGGSLPFILVSNYRIYIYIYRLLQQYHHDRARWSTNRSQGQRNRIGDYLTLFRAYNQNAFTQQLYPEGTVLIEAIVSLYAQKLQ